MKYFNLRLASPSLSFLTPFGMTVAYVFRMVLFFNGSFIKSSLFWISGFTFKTFLSSVSDYSQIILNTSTFSNILAAGFKSTFNLVGLRCGNAADSI